MMDTTDTPDTQAVPHSNPPLEKSQIIRAYATEAKGLWDPELYISAAIMHLKEARDFLSKAGTERACDKVRKAISSAEGARRNVEKRNKPLIP